ILAAAIVLGGLSTMNAQAQEETTTPAETAPTEQAAPAEATTTEQAAPAEAAASDEFVEIKAEEVPAAVNDALKAAYPDAVVNKASVNGKKEYELQIKAGDKSGVLYADESGKWIQK
ncbi:MAG: hypothetical protein ABI554_13750, partial [Flavobacterium sp.]